MVGLGENDEEVSETINDLFDAGCKILTVGQYLQPTKNHMEAVSYITPEKFSEYKEMALKRVFNLSNASSGSLLFSC